MEEDQAKALTVIFNTDKDRGGAVRVGLKLGDTLSRFLDVDIAKMESRHDKDLFSELSMESDVISLPENKKLKKVVNGILRQDLRLTNVLISTYLSDIDISEYDVVHLHNPIPLAAMAQVATRCKLVGVPYCVTTHGISKLPDTPESANLSWWQIPIFEYGFFKPYLQILGNADHLFALSKHDRERIRTHFPDQSVSITPNGVQLNPPKARDNRDAKRTFGIPEEIPVLLFAGKILKSKGIDDLIAVHETIEAKHKMIVAGEPEDEEFVAKLETTDSDLEYVGYTSRDELNLLFRRADLFIFPTRTDVFPLVVLEAMAAKTPVVSTTVGGIPEQVSDEVGVLVPPQQPRMMAKEIDELLSNKSQRDRLSENAFDRIKNNYTWSQIAKRVADKYSELDSTS